jgi:high-affinity iron transporter
MLKHHRYIFLLIFLLFLTGSVFAKNTEPTVINVIVTKTEILFSPNRIPENTPFIIHVINQSSTPIELENADTSVEIYANMDKTFKVGLTAGNYIFFNDFNPHTKKAILLVQSAEQFKNKAFISHPTFIKTAFQNKELSSNLNISEIVFVIWRESVEALLVVGVVYQWLKQLKTSRRSGFLSLWIGIFIGLIFAIFLSFLLIKTTSILSPDFATLFQAGMTFIAAIMIVYMVKWMRNNAKTLKSSMHQVIQKKSSIRWRNISIITVVSVAFAREASEASIFIYALGFNSTHYFSFTMAAILLLGIILAIITISILQLGNKLFSWRLFFKCTEILLLLLGGGLLLNCIDHLILSGWLTPIYSKIWDTSFLIKENGLISPILSSFTGYRSAPSLMDVIGYSVYWIVIYFLLKTKKDNIHAT